MSGVNHQALLASYKGGGDPYYGNVSLLLKGEGPDTSTNIIDQSPNPKTVTANGDTKIDTAQFKFGTSSIKFPGTFDTLIVPSSAAFNLMGGDFTMEAFLRLSTAGGVQTIFCLGTNNGNREWVEVNSGKLCFGTSTNSNWSNKITGTTTIGNTAWRHIALTKEGGTFRLFVDGNLEGSSGTGAFTVTDRPLGIGGNTTVPELFLDGWLDEIRITKGVARYTANFTPPTEGFPIN